MPAAFANWRDDTPGQTGVSPYIGPPPLLRNALDAERMAWRQTPGASYPDGYLGTVNSRQSGRQDLVNDAVFHDRRSYTRGVHKGECLDMSDYLWPIEFNLWSGLEAEARGERFVSSAMKAQAPALVNDGKPGPSDARLGYRTGSNVPVVNISDSERYAAMLPTWT